MGHPVDAHVGARLRFLRSQRGLSQTELGNKVGVTFQQILKYEKGTNRISASKLFEFTRILDVRVQDFFSGLRDVDGQQAAPAPVATPSTLDFDILRVLGDLEDGRVKRQLLRMLEAVTKKEARRSRRTDVDRKA